VLRYESKRIESFNQLFLLVISAFFMEELI
jgi:hypothetical protein